MSKESVDNIPTAKHVSVSEKIKSTAIRCIQENIRVDDIGSEELRLAVRSLFTELLKEDPHRVEKRLKRFFDYYNKLSPEFKLYCSWEEFQRRMIADDFHYLILAEAMEGGGVLFAVDDLGNPLIADGGTEPLFKNLTYREARDKVYFLDKEGKQLTGYEMFPALEGSEKSSEVLDFEQFINGTFVGCYEDGSRGVKSSWLESGEEVEVVSDAYFDPEDNRVSIYSGTKPSEKVPWRGVRRLLRVKTR